MNPDSIEKQKKETTDQINLDFRTDAEVRDSIRKKGYQNLDLRESNLQAKDREENKSEDQYRYGH